MTNTIRLIAVMILTAGAVAAAQNQPAPMGPPRGAPMVAGMPMGAPEGGRSAQRLLARSAELDLTDAQVVKLAGIARRAEARQRARGSAMDSAGMRFGQPGDSLARRQFAQRMQADMAKERDQAHVDLRDALAALTPDQQAKAWEMAAGRARAGRGMGGMRGGRGNARMGGARGMGQAGRGAQMGPGGQMGPGARRGGAARPRPPRPPVDGLPPASGTE